MSPQSLEDYAAKTYPWSSEITSYFFLAFSVGFSKFILVFLQRTSRTSGIKIITFASQRDHWCICIKTQNDCKRL